jgi:hypothetical protein
LILKALVKHKELYKQELFDVIPEEPERVSRMISALEEEGFILHEQNQYRLAD